MRDVAIDRIMTTDAITIGPNAPILKARKVLESNDLNHLPVVEDQKLVGIISTSDMLKFAMLDENAAVLESVRVGQVMRENPHVLSVDANLRQAADQLSSGGYHALPVVEPDRTLVGIVTTSDLIRHLLRQIPTGDGSMRTETLASAGVGSGNVDLAAVLEEIEQIAAGGYEVGQIRNVVVSLSERNRRLDAVVQAAERYVRSGHADREHTILVKRLSDLRESSAAVSL